MMVNRVYSGLNEGCGCRGCRVRVINPADFCESGKLHFADFFHLRKGLYGDFVWGIEYIRRQNGLIVCNLISFKIKQRKC